MRPSEIRARADKKFTPAHKELFKKLYLIDNISARKLAKEFKIRNSTANDFVRTFLKPEEGESLIGFKCVNRKLDKNQVSEILSFRFEKKYSTARIAGMYDVSQSTIQQIVSGRSWKFMYKKYFKKPTR